MTNPIDINSHNYRIDLLRTLLIFCVIFGHMIEPLNDDTVYKTLYLMIYLFHIPLFVGISGFLTRENIPKGQRFKSLIPILIPLAVFTLLYEIYELFNSGHLSKYPLLIVPYWILWYLYSLVCWRLLFPIVNKLKYPVIITLIISITAGFTPLIGYGFGLSRTLYFFPFFLMGHYYRISNRAPLQFWPKNRIINILILLIAGFIMYQCRGMNEEWLYGSYSYVHFSKVWWQGALIRTAIYLLSFSVSLSITSLMLSLPNRQSFLSRLGVNTLYAYIWHGFLIKLLMDHNIISKIGELHPLAGTTICAAISLIAALILTTNAVKKATKKLLFIPIQKLLKPILHRIVPEDIQG